MNALFVGHAPLDTILRLAEGGIVPSYSLFPMMLLIFLIMAEAYCIIP